MTEIQFLVKLLLEDSIVADIKELIAARIAEIDGKRSTIQFQPLNVNPWPKLTNPNPLEGVCLHEYSFPWELTTDRRCKKCGHVSPSIATNSRV
jgi:hypothetical protein